ncbi:squalene/phytoene synthase family protein, partial [Luteimonas sp. SDU101]
MNDPDSLDSFLGKWRARWPEWELLSVFVPAPQRGTVAAWYALLDELGDAAWAGTDPTPGLAKLAWWQEELLGWQRGARRHPLGQALQRLAAPWDTLGRALASLPQTRSA